LKRGATVVEEPFYDRIVGNFTVYQDRIETNLLLLFAQPYNSEWFSITFAIIFEVIVVAAHKQA